MVYSTDQVISYLTMTKRRIRHQQLMYFLNIDARLTPDLDDHGCYISPNIVLVISENAVRSSFISNLALTYRRIRYLEIMIVIVYFIWKT